MVFRSSPEGGLAHSEARVLLREGAGGGAWDEDRGGTGPIAAFSAAKEQHNHDKTSQGTIFTPKHAAANLRKVS